MKIMIEIGHPKQVHFWKNIIKKLTRNGHEIKVMAKEKDITLYLLNAYEIKYEFLGKNYTGLPKKVYGLLESNFNVIKTANKFKPDLFIGGPSFAQISRIFRKSHIALSDTEHARFHSWLTFPFSDVICTPSCFKGKVNSKKHIVYNGYEELAYLHLNYFKPDPTVLDELGLTKNDKIIIIRLISWTATHDTNHSGISHEMKIKYASELEKYGRIFITCEDNLGIEFEKYKLKIEPEKFHSLLSYAQLYIGEGGSTATEAAILGTPSIHISTTAKFCGVFDDLLKYGLVYTFDDDRKALEKAIEILNDKKSKETWMRKKDIMLKEKIDVTEFMTELIEGYPESFHAAKNRVM